MPRRFGTAKTRILRKRRAALDAKRPIRGSARRKSRSTSSAGVTRSLGLWSEVVEVVDEP